MEKKKDLLSELQKAYSDKLIHKSFIVIELIDLYFDYSPIIIEDEQGMPEIFKTIEEAQEAAKSCVYPHIVEVPSY